jgi:pentatricopeptide repeat protein
LLSEDIALGNALIDMHAKCGKLAQAHQLLERLHERHVVSWNALISGYVQHGRLDEAWHCFKQMQSEGLCPNVITLVCILKACGTVNGMYKGRQIHSILNFSWNQQEDGVVLGNALVDMYVKCGMVAKAHEVLRELPVCDAISWNTLIAGYVQQGQLHEASTCFEEMQRGEAVSPNSVTFLCILKVCSIIGDVDKGKQIHREIVKWSLLEKDSALSNALVDMYAKCGELEKAQEVFEELLLRDIASWSALIAGYARQDRCRDAFNCFEQMRNEGVAADEPTLICVLKACASTGAIDKGIEIHESLVNRRLLEKDVMLGTALVDMYAKCRMPEKAQQVLERLPRRDAIAWNALIAGYAQQGKCGEALNCFRLMRSEGVAPDSVTFVCVLKACGDAGSMDQGMRIHDEIVGERLLGRDAILGNSLVGMYAKCGALDRARAVLRELPVQDAASWNAIIAGYVQQGCSLEALGCFEQMRDGSVSADAVTFVCILKACGMVGAVSKGERIHEEALARGLLEKQSYAIANALIDMYARCGLLGKAALVLDSLSTRDIVAWNALVAGYAQQGRGREALICFGCIEIEALVPDSITCLGVLTACCHSGHVDEARSVFRDMTEKYGIAPSSEHRTCMVVLLGCSGQFGTALSAMELMPPADQLGTLLALLGACQKWGNVRLGKLAFDQALQIDRSCAAAYVLMANLFSMTGMHEDASEVEARRLMHAACKLQEDSVDFDGGGDLYWKCSQNGGDVYLP